MKNRRTRRPSGLVLEEVNETTIEWTFHSPLLGFLDGQLQYSDWHDGGWSITGLPSTGSDDFSMWLIPTPLMEAVKMIEDRIDAAEIEVTKPSPQDERRKAELESLFGSGPD